MQDSALARRASTHVEELRTGNRTQGQRYGAHR